MPKTSSSTTSRPMPAAAARRTMSCCGSEGGPIAAGAGLRGRDARARLVIVEEGQGRSLRKLAER